LALRRQGGLAATMRWSVMRLRFVFALLLLLVLVGAGGFAFLAYWDAPPAQNRVEKVIPNERLAR